jgi:WD40 repeat protein
MPGRPQVDPVRPFFELRRLYGDGTISEPLIYPISEAPLSTEMGRRGLFGAGLTASGLLALLPGCAVRRGGTTKTPSGPLFPAIPKAHSYAISAVAVPPDGSRIVSASAQGELKDWPYPHGGEAQVQIISNLAKIEAMTFVRGYFISQPRTDSTVIEAWTLPATVPQALMPGHSERVTSVAVPADGGWFASLAGGSEVLVWSSDSLASLGRIPHAGSAIDQIAAPPNGRFLITATRGPGLQAWSMPGGAPMQVFQRESGLRVTALTVTADSRFAVSGDELGNLAMLSLDDGSEYAKVTAHAGIITKILTAPDGRRFISASTDQTVKIWSADTPQAPLGFFRHRYPIRSIAMIPQTDLVVTGDEAGLLVIWSLTTLNIVQYLFDPAVNSRDTISVRYTVSDRDRLVTRTMPCGSPLPTGATCTCNCVAGDRRLPNPAHQPGPCQSVCTCNTVCTCLAVRPPG